MPSERETEQWGVPVAVAAELVAAIGEVRVVVDPLHFDKDVTKGQPTAHIIMMLVRRRRGGEATRGCCCGCWGTHILFFAHV